MVRIKLYGVLKPDCEHVRTIVKRSAGGIWSTRCRDICADLDEILVETCVSVVRNDQYKIIFHFDVLDVQCSRYGSQ